MRRALARTDPAGAPGARRASPCSSRSATGRSRRLAWKEELIARVDGAADRAGRSTCRAGLATWPERSTSQTNEYRPVPARPGDFLPTSEALVFTSLSDPKGPFGGPGFWVVTPFALAGGGTVVYVNRGFVPQGRQRADDAASRRAGRVDRDRACCAPTRRRHWFTPDDRPERERLLRPRRRGDRRGERRLRSRLRRSPSTSSPPRRRPAGCRRRARRAWSLPTTILQYAITWYGLAAALLAVFASFAWAGCARAGPEAALDAAGRGSLTARA